MAFKEVTDLNADVTTAIGGVNKKTGKKNPNTVEGYYLGSRKVESRKSKTGFASLHILQTAKGNLGVWGKTDLDRKMSTATIGAMLRITNTGTVPTPNGEMYKYKVEMDLENTIEVSAPVSDESSDGGAEYSSSNEESYSSDDDGGMDSVEEAEQEEESYEAPPVRNQAAALSAAERKAKVQSLLKGGAKAAK